MFAVWWCGVFWSQRSAISAAAQPYNEAQFKGMKWRDIGPYRGGRVLAVTGIPGSPFTYYFGGVAGGVWRTTDGGVSWQPISDKSVISSIGAIAVSESNPNVIYVGTGESCLRGNISYGDGVYKTTDGGKTWQHIGLKDTQHIARVWIDPRNSDHVLVAALGHAYGPNPDRGIFRTTDGGKTWDKILYKDDKSGAIDLAVDPHNSNVMFAALYQIQRTPWSLESGGPGSGLYRSTDGGNSWKHLEGKGLPEGILGRIGVSVSGADSNRVYALIESKQSGLYRSDDGGETWSRVNDDQRLTQRAWYFTHIFADPKSADTVYMLNTGVFRSTDGGKTLNLLPAPHGDHHGFWIDPQNPNRMINVERRRGDDLGGWRQELVHAVQPADGAVLPRRGGQRLSLQRVWRAAGQLDRRHRQPHRRRLYRPPALVRCGRRRERLHCARSAGLEHYLCGFGRRRGHAPRSPQQPGAGHHGLAGWIARGTALAI